MRWIVRLVVVAALAGLGWLIWSRLADDEGGGPRERSPAAVSVAPVERGAIAERRIFSGSLEASARFVVAPKVGGRVASLAVDLGDPVERGQVVATLDDAEFTQAVEEARAELAVAEAQVAEARATARVASKEQERVSSLSNKGVLSASQRDQIEATAATADAAVRVARARVEAARAALAAARVRLGYTQVTADWPDGEGARVVAARAVDAGETVAANAALMTIVDLRPLTGVIHVTEADYARLRAGQAVALRTDAWPGRTFEGRISRIAPVFREASRQARVELSVENADGALKPGMFVRATATLARVDDARVVPVSALAVRDGVEGVFVVDGEVREGAAATARWRPVERGLAEGERVQIEGEVTGHVVTLGQQLIDDGSAVTIAALGAASVEEEAGERALRRARDGAGEAGEQPANGQGEQGGGAPR